MRWPAFASTLIPTIESLTVLWAIVSPPKEAPCAVLRVPSQFETICQATFLAQDGDTVLVEPGTYYYQLWECIPIRDGVVVTSERGPLETTVFCWVLGPVLDQGVIRIEGDAGPDTEVSGFTLVFYDESEFHVPSAVYCFPGARPRITGNVFYPDPRFPYSFYDGPVIRW